MGQCDLRIMLIIGNATLCIIDGADAVVHGLAGGNFVRFICHLNLDLLLAEYVKQVEKEYRELYQEIQETFRDDTFVGERAEHSVRLAEAAGVKKEKIVRSLDDLDDLFL